MSMPAEILRPHCTLDQLLPGTEGVRAIPISGISTDSRHLSEGDLFIACQGATSHGLDFIDQAIAAGVAAIAWDSLTASSVKAPVPMIPVADLANQVGDIANRWFDSPTSKMRVAGVTGTNGKTTVAYLISQCLQFLQSKCAYIGTLGNGISDVGDGGYMTTPACIELHHLFADFHNQGADFAALEVSSHALEQRRVDGVHFDVAIFTNLTRDHIDYHGSMQAYGESKATLFLDYDVRYRVINIDSEFGLELANRCAANVVTVSTSMEQVTTGRPHVFARSVVSNASGSDVSITSSFGNADIRLPLPGDFNVANALSVLATLLCWDVSLEDACEALEAVSAPPGRMQLVSIASDDLLPTVYVDYSHTPASLEAALCVLRSHCSGQLWCVFGCGGDRDRGKRPMMGKVAMRYSDMPVATSDNPRSEDPGSIIRDVLEGMDEGSTAITDRADAIQYAISHAGAGDTVLIAGKGHEHYQEIGNERVLFSDFKTAEACLVKKRGPAEVRS
jgi:UDP-N-acetylmuramoyl-L-alanyl-D-glutamate--2,6-diaminopimelate ligase